MIDGYYSNCPSHIQLTTGLNLENLYESIRVVKLPQNRRVYNLVEILLIWYLASKSNLVKLAAEVLRCT